MVPGNINGDDAVDTPITIKVTKQGKEIHRTNTIVVPYGHYSYSFNFAESGIYTIDILVKDKIYETRSSLPNQAQGILFTFPIDVHSKVFFGFFNFQTILTVTVVVVIVSSIIFYSVKKIRMREKRRIIQVKRPDSASPMPIHTSSTLPYVKPTLNFVLNLPLNSISVCFYDSGLISFKSTTSESIYTRKTR